VSQGLISKTLHLKPEDHRRVNNLCGPLNQNIELIEKGLEIKIKHRGNVFELNGKAAAVNQAAKILTELYQATTSEKHININHIQAYFHEREDEPELHPHHETKIISISGLVKAKTPNQKKYLHSLQEYDINFAIGPAGTGKTFLAVAAAVAALQKEEVTRIILVRPAVEAGEKLGFLPGNLAEKIDPYLRPLYDSLFEMLGGAKVTKLIEAGVIEIAPLAYMRGRTLNDSYVILDEAQNTTVEQMKMFLTRIGFGSKAVITGDTTQIDLPKSIPSGLAHAAKVLKEVEPIKFNHFSSKDVVRHPLVQMIINAYEDYSD
jgi:phosphate starvation-inducible PhoH-like protein